jgi:hypothetical protein
MKLTNRDQGMCSGFTLPFSNTKGSKNASKSTLFNRKIVLNNSNWLNNVANVQKYLNNYLVLKKISHFYCNFFFILPKRLSFFPVSTHRPLLLLLF